MIVVTGAFSYTGKYLSKLLLERGERVRNLTGHPERPNPFAGQVEVAPMDFADLDSLARAMDGATGFVNTYWVRFSYKGMTFDRAVANSKLLFDAAKRAGVERIVHTSITNPSLDSPLGYYKGKAEVEENLNATGIPYSILRPNVIFGKEDVLINNIAWFLRRFPMFGVPGDGRYGMQPIYVEDFAQLMLGGISATGNEIKDACGPEAFSFNEWLHRIGEAIGHLPRVVHVSPEAAFQSTSLIGRFVKDVVLTREEIKGLMDGLLVSNEPPQGTTKLTEWMAQNADWLGKTYANEVGRHFK